MRESNERRFARKRRQDELLKVAEQAAAWLIDLEDGGTAERAACAAWFEESPLHVEMFLRASSVDRLTELMAPEDVRKLAERSAKSRTLPGGAGGTSPFPLSRAPSLSRHRGKVKKRWALSLAAGVIALVCGGVWYGWFGPNAWDAYVTGVGEQRAVALSDGSVVYVNTDTAIDVRYTDRAREVRLRSGEALFKVERDARRPFRVHVGDTVVQAIGTQFNIYRRSHDTTVAVIEGAVQVSNASGQDSAAQASTSVPKLPHRTSTASERNAERLAAGQGVRLSGKGAMTPAIAVNVAQVTAWRQRRLVFEWQTLDEITAEFNRYNRAPQIRIEGEDVRQRRYTAVFDADNPQTLLKFLSRDDDLQFAAEGDDFVIRSR